MSVPIYDIRLSPLEISEVVSRRCFWLDPPRSDDVLFLPSIEPKGGEVYVYQGESEKHKDSFYMHI